jgi:hypothetical protein
MTAVVIPFLGRNRMRQRAAPVLTEADVDQAQQSVATIAPGRLRLEATACLEIATACAGTAEGLVWEVRALFCLTRMLDAALPPDRRMEA